MAIWQLVRRHTERSIILKVTHGYTVEKKQCIYFDCCYMEHTQPAARVQYEVMQLSTFLASFQEYDEFEAFYNVISTLYSRGTVGRSFECVGSQTPGRIEQSESLMHLEIISYSRFSLKARMQQPHRDPQLTPEPPTPRVLVPAAQLAPIDFSAVGLSFPTQAPPLRS